MNGGMNAETTESTRATSVAPTVASTKIVLATSFGSRMPLPILSKEEMRLDIVQRLLFVGNCDLQRMLPSGQILMRVEDDLVLISSWDECQTAMEYLRQLWNRPFRIFDSRPPCKIRYYERTVHLFGDAPKNADEIIAAFIHEGICVSEDFKHSPTRLSPRLDPPKNDALLS